MKNLSKLVGKVILWAWVMNPTNYVWGQFEIHQKIVGERESRAEFGTSTSIHGSFMAVGASRENVAAGAAYVYQFNGTSWDSLQKIVPEDGNSMAEFGGAMKMNENHLVIAAGRADIGETFRAGALYVYELNASQEWTFTQKLTASNLSDDALLGVNPTSMDAQNTTIVAGAPGKENWKGAVYVFEKSGNEWMEVQIITAPEPIEFTNFGIGVSLFDNRMIIGASGENNGSGAAYLYEKNENGTWIFTQKITASTPQATSYFGSSVSIYDNQLVVGAYAEGNPGTDFASVYIFSQNENGTWVETQKINGNPSAEDSYFGWMTQITDQNLWVSAPHVWGEEAGKIHHYQKQSNGIWEEVQIIQPTENMVGDAFGWSFDFHDSVLAVGVARDDFDELGENETQDAGSAMVFVNPNLSLINWDDSESEIQIYPNPAKNHISIQSKENLKKVEVYDLNGKLLISSTNKTFSVLQLPKAVYILKITLQSGKQNTKKLIKN